MNYISSVICPVPIRIIGKDNATKNTKIERQTGVIFHINSKIKIQGLFMTDMEIKCLGVLSKQKLNRSQQNMVC